MAKDRRASALLMIASAFLVIASALVDPHTLDSFSLAAAALIFFFFGAATLIALSLATNRLPQYPPAGLSATSQQYFSLTTNQHQPPASQQYFSLTTNQHQPTEQAVIVTHGMSSSCKEVVLDFVERQTISLLGISGMRGVGKTTLLRFVRHSYAHHGSSPYHNRVFFVGAAGTGRTAVARLQYALAVHIGLGPPPQISDAAKIISTSLKGRPFLLLLDDVRERLDLAAVGLPMPLGRRQKVIFTTRNQAICSEMGDHACSNSIHMECLGEDDAWNLFKDKVGQEIIDAHPHIKHLANKMAAECRGLPSTLCALARAMSTKTDVKEWRYAYDALKRKRPPPVDEIQEMDDQD